MTSKFSTKFSTKPRHIPALALFTLLLLFAAPALAQRSVMVIDEARITSWLEDSQSALKAPALAVGIVGPDNVLFLEVFGDPDEDDAFLLGPVSQSFTALALLQVLKDHDDYSLETAASTWFSSIPTEVTLRDLLHQTSGLQSTASPYRNVDATLEELLAGADWHPRGTETDEDLHFALLGHIAAQIADQPFAELVEERVFAPLELTSASASPALATRDLAPGHQLFFGFPARRAEPKINPHFVPALFISMSPRDMLSWLHLVLERASPDGAELPPEFLEELEPLFARSTGTTATSTAAFAVRQDEQIAAFVLTNHNSLNAGGPTRILDGILATLLNEEPPRGSNIEFILRLMMGFFLFLVVLNFLYDLVRWLAIRSFKIKGRPLTVALLTPLFTTSIALAVHFFWMPLPLIYATQPDVAIALVLFATLFPLSRLLGGLVHTYRTDAQSVQEHFGFS